MPTATIPLHPEDIPREIIDRDTGNAHERKPEVVYGGHWRRWEGNSGGNTSIVKYSPWARGSGRLLDYQIPMLKGGVSRQMFTDGFDSSVFIGEEVCARVGLYTNITSCRTNIKPVLFPFHWTQRTVCGSMSKEQNRIKLHNFVFFYLRPQWFPGR